MSDPCYTIVACLMKIRNKVQTIRWSHAGWLLCDVIGASLWCHEGFPEYHHQWLDANKTLNQSYVLFIALVALHIKVGINISHLSIPGIVNCGRCYISHCFTSPGHCFKLFLCAVLPLFKRVIDLTNFLFKSKFISFPICDSAHLLYVIIITYNYYFCYYLLLIFFYMFCFTFSSHFHCLVMARYL